MQWWRYITDTLALELCIAVTIGGIYAYWKASQWISRRVDKWSDKQR